jgi:hypothetical protein
MPATRNANWIEVLEGTLPGYAKKVEKETIRKRLSLNRLEKRGRIQFNKKETDWIWLVQNAEITPVAQISGPVTYTPHALHTQARLSPRGYINGESMREMDVDHFASEMALINRWKDSGKLLIEGLRNKVGEDLYIDGSATGNSLNFEGLETLFAIDTDPTTIVTDLVGCPSDTYAGLSTDLAQDGTWSTDLGDGAGISPNDALGSDWPEGKGDPEYDYWSPLLVNWSSTSWGTATNTWEANCERALSRTNQWLQVVKGFTGSPDTCIMSGPLLTGLKNSLKADRQYMVSGARGPGDFGLPETIPFEGMDCWTEYGVPASTAYMYRTEDVELYITKDQLFTVKGPFYDENTLMYKMLVICWGNFKFKSPRRFAKLHNYAAS